MVNTANIPKAYSEVYEFINTLGEEYINKLPVKVYNTIKENRDMNYKPTYNKNQKLDRNRISKEALSLISALNLQYWCSNENTKQELKQTYLNNAKKEQEKYRYENIFKTENKMKEMQNENTQIIEYKKESLFQRIRNKIKNFLINKKMLK